MSIYSTRADETISISVSQKLVNIISSIVLRRPAKTVWEFITASDNMKLWLTGFIRFEQLSGTAGTVGAVSKHVYEMNGKPFELLEEITVREEYSKFGGILINPMVLSTILNEFIARGENSTELRCMNDVTFKGWMRLFSPFMKKVFQKRQDSDLEQLKSIIESQ